MADVVLWNGTPFSVYAHAEQVYIDGALLFDRAIRRAKPFRLHAGGAAMSCALDR